jgi:hypothetical protein
VHDESEPKNPGDVFRSRAFYLSGVMDADSKDGLEPASNACVWRAAGVSIIYVPPA